MIEGPSKMTFGTSNLLLFFLAEGYMTIKGVLDSTRPGLHNGLRIFFFKNGFFNLQYEYSHTKKVPVLTIELL
jgi:hypothetical protein